MKNHYFLFTLFFLTINLVDAQSNWTKGVALTFGFSGQSQLETSENNISTYNIQSKLMPTFGGGFWIERSFGQYLGIESGLNYAYLQHFKRRQTTEYRTSAKEGVSDIIKNDYRFIAHQLSIPLKIHCFLNKRNKAIRPFFNIGIQASYYLSVVEKKQFLSMRKRSITFEDEKKYHAVENKKLINDHPISSYSFGFGLDFGAFRVTINRTQNALKANTQLEDDAGCNCFSHQITHSIPSIHATSTTLEYKF